MLRFPQPLFCVIRLVQHALRIALRSRGHAFLKVLVIFTAVAVAAPGKAVLDKEPVAQVVLVNFIGKTGCAGGGSRRDCLAAILFIGDAGIVAGIDVQGKSQGVPGKGAVCLGGSIIKTEGIVVLPCGIRVTVVFVYQEYFFQLVLVAVQLIQDFHQVLGDILAADEFSFFWHTRKVVMPDMDVTKFFQLCQSGGTLPVLCLRFRFRRLCGGTGLGLFLAGLLSLPCFLAFSWQDWSGCFFHRVSSRIGDAGDIAAQAVGEGFIIEALCIGDACLELGAAV